MKDILTIIKKELTRFFTDYRMLGAMIIPGILIYVIYSFLGPAINSNMSTSKDYKYQVYVINKDETIISSLEEAFKVAEYNVEILEATDLGLIEDAVANENTDLIIEFNNDTTPISINPRSVKTALKNFFDSSFPFSFSSSVNTGIKLATILPSANKRLKRLGSINPMAKASAINVVPSNVACI